MDLFKDLLELDTALFYRIQSGNHVILDQVMLLLRNPPIWIPLYMFMLWWCYRQLKPSIAIAFIVGTLLCFGLADFSSSSLFKPLIERPRPCAVPSMEPYVRELVGCGGVYGFPSSHAANHFALASFWYWAIFIVKGRRWNWLFIWALAICYAQVYVGKHYPLDVLAGGFLGLVIGTSMAKLFEWWITRGNDKALRVRGKASLPPL